MLDMPMLAHPRGTRGSGPPQTRKGDAGGPRDGRGLVRRANRFYGHDRLEAGPLGKRWERGAGCPRPDASPPQPSVRVVACIKEVRGIAPRDMGRNVLMQVLCDRCVGLFGIAFQGPKIVAPVGPDVLRGGCLTAHRIKSDQTPFDGSQREEVRHGRQRSGLRVCLALA
jgi:hypothetical protein